MTPQALIEILAQRRAVLKRLAALSDEAVAAIPPRDFQRVSRYADEADRAVSPDRRAAADRL